MKPLRMRGFSVGLFTLYCFLSAIIITYAIFAYAVVQSDVVPTEIRLPTCIVIAVFFLLPGILLFLNGIKSFCTRIEIYSDRIMYKRPFQKWKNIKIQQITFWGCAAYAYRSNMLFFCTEDPTVVTEYLRAHWNQCVKIHGANLVDKLQHNESGMFQLAVGTYLRIKLCRIQDKIFVLQYASPKRLHQISQVMNKDAILAGPCLINCEFAWKNK